MSYENRHTRKELALFCLEKRRGGDLITVFKYLKGDFMEDRDRLFSVSARDRTRAMVLNCRKENLIWDDLVKYNPTLKLGAGGNHLD